MKTLEQSSVFYIRDKPIYHCSKCGKGIYASDISQLLFCYDQEIQHRIPIYCPNCHHVDEIGKVRDYPRPKKQPNILIEI